MIQFKQMICPVSAERIDENRVRVTAMGVVLTMGGFIITGNILFAGFLVIDFYIRAFTKFTNSPLSWLGQIFVQTIGTKPILIDKAPKIFAARIGFILSAVTVVGAIAGLPLLAAVMGVILVGFAFLECGLNFCAGCWVYTYVVFPLVRKS